MPTRGSKGEQSRRTRHRDPSRPDDGERAPTHDGERAPTHDGERAPTHDGERAPTHDGERGLAPGGEDRLHPRARMALATWPQIDPAVEAIVDQIGDAHRYLMSEMRDSLAHVGLTLEEFKVLMELRGGTCTHGVLSRNLEVSTGAMTNRLDKLEREGLVRRDPDPSDRRGVLLSLTDAGSERLDAYIDRGAHRERKLLEGLTQTEKRRLNDLLAKLLDLLRAERGG